MAIFAPDRDPLAFHKAIAIIALKLLAPGGCSVVELNTELAEETATVFKKAGFSSVEIIRDFFDRPRFVSFRK
jgi:release factor glutamine methyltransferase